MRQFIKFEKEFKKCTAFIFQASSGFITPEKKTQCLVRLISLINKNFDLTKQYGNEKYNMFFSMLYKKSFRWVKDANEKQIICAPTFTRFFKKFRKKYEISRYANWEFLRSLFNLDPNIMFLIDSYM